MTNMKQGTSAESIIQISRRSLKIHSDTQAMQTMSIEQIYVMFFKCILNKRWFKNETKTISCVSRRNHQIINCSHVYCFCHICIIYVRFLRVFRHTCR